MHVFGWDGVWEEGMVWGNEGNEGIKGKTVMLCMCMDGVMGLGMNKWFLDGSMVR